MAIPDGIVERKDMKVTCAPPWGTNYEMKAKKNAKQLSFFPNDRENAKGYDTRCQNIVMNREVPKMTSDSEALYTQGSEVMSPAEPATGADLSSPMQLEGKEYTENISYESATNSNSVEGTTSNSSNSPSSTVFGSKKDKIVRSSARMDFETSNSAYGHHKTTPTEYEGDLPKTYRRVCSFSKLYGDTQPWKK